MWICFRRSTRRGILVIMILRWQGRPVRIMAILLNMFSNHMRSKTGVFRRSRGRKVRELAL